MFGIGFSELLIIALAMIVFIKPEDLPKLFRKLGKVYRSIKKAYAELVQIRDHILKEVDDMVPKDIVSENPLGKATQKPPVISAPSGKPGAEGSEAAAAKGAAAAMTKEATVQTAAPAPSSPPGAMEPPHAAEAVEPAAKATMGDREDAVGGAGTVTGDVPTATRAGDSGSHEADALEAGGLLLSRPAGHASGFSRPSGAPLPPRIPEPDEDGGADSAAADSAPGTADPKGVSIGDTGESPSDAATGHSGGPKDRA